MSNPRPRTHWACGWLAIVAFVALTANARAQTPLLRFSMDQVDQGMIYTKEDNAPPTVVPGRFGNALRFTSTATVARAYELDAVDYPVVTITAWVKLEEDASGNRSIFSNGSATGPQMLIGGRALYGKIGGQGVAFVDHELPIGQWVFVAAVLNKTEGSVRLHIDDVEHFDDEFNQGYSPPKEVCNPRDDSIERQAYVFVGAQKFCPFTGGDRPVSIDEVRVYAGALTTGQLAHLRGTIPLPCRDVPIGDIDFDPSRPADFDSTIEPPGDGSILQPCVLGDPGDGSSGGQLPGLPGPVVDALSCRKLPDGAYVCRRAGASAGSEEFLCESLPSGREMDCEPLQSQPVRCIPAGTDSASRRFTCVRDAGR